MNDKFKNDKLKFELIRNADLVCTDCLYKYDDTNMPCNVSKCEMYEEKPSTVIDGGNCDLYDKGGVGMKYVAYHRTSTKDQHLDRGIAELTKYCKTHNIQLYKSKVYTDQRTGKDFDRPRYIMLKEEILESGDVLIVTELDRLGRNKEATLKELRFFKDNGIRVMVLELPTTLIDLSAMENSMARMMLETINNMMIELYASMAQVEIEKREKRQREGIEQKKARGEWDDYGRPRVMDLEEFATHYRLVQQGKKKPFELMRELGMTKPTFYRYKNQIKKGC